MKNGWTDRRSWRRKVIIILAKPTRVWAFISDVGRSKEIICVTILFTSTRYFVWLPSNPRALLFFVSMEKSKCTIISTCTKRTCLRASSHDVAFRTQLCLLNVIEKTCQTFTICWRNVVGIRRTSNIKNKARIVFAEDTSRYQTRGRSWNWGCGSFSTLQVQTEPTREHTVVSNFSWKLEFF